ncbi:MAG: MafI family immunity protein [Myxococcales bacterium]|nr:MafI family immunity protein [Myxococcales bacterium]
MSSDFDKHYRKVDETIRELLQDLQHFLSAEERAEVEVFLDAGEYGVALETLWEILRESKKTVSEQALAEVRKLARSMQLTLEALPPSSE